MKKSMIAGILMLGALLAFGGAQLGIYCRKHLPDTHLGAESKDTVKLLVGLIATMTALVLGLVVASAKSSFDETDAGVKHFSGKLLTLDRLLARYGPETAETRDMLRRVVTARVDAIWPEESALPATPRDKMIAKMGDAKTTYPIEEIEDRIHRLAPQNDRQRWLQSRALTLSSDLLQDRWLMLAGRTSDAVPVQFLVALTFWLTAIFGIFGLLAPRNATVIAVQFVSAFSVAISIFLVLELGSPFGGLIKVSSHPIRYALSHLGQ